MKTTKITIITGIFLFILTQALSGNPLGGTVLALYKSSDSQSADGNEIAYFVEQHLTGFGLKTQYHNIDSGIPAQSALKDTRAIITWFRGPGMKDTTGYFNFLNNAINRGIKVIILNNFGAYQNTTNGAWIDPGEINYILSRLGVRYQGDWTDNKSLIKTVQKNRNIINTTALENPKQGYIYYHFLPVDRELKVYLSLRRTDRSHGASPVIFSNRNGGFVLDNYLIRMEENNNVSYLIDFEKFLKECLFPGPSQLEVAILADTKEAASATTLYFTQSVLETAKLPYTTIGTTDFPKLLPYDLNRFSAAVLINRGDNNLNPEVLENLLKNGGGLVSLVGGYFNTLAPYLGIQSSDNEPEQIKGYRMRYGFLLGEGVSIDNTAFPWISGYSKPMGKSNILATNYDGSKPLLWETEIQEGKALVWNWDGFAFGDLEGFILESILHVMPVGAAGMPAIGMFHINDWPLPMYNAKKENPPVTDTDFYTRTWWNDIKTIFAEAEIPFTSYITFNYNSKVNPPFQSGELYVAEKQASVNIAREILENGWDLGLYGYNHVSLSEKPSGVNVAYWPSQNNMEQALTRIKDEWQILLGEHSSPAAYAAPHNIISEAGMAALKKVFPSLQSISTTTATGGEETITKFASNKDVPGLFYIPRSSEGYIFDGETTPVLVSSISGYGLLSHSIFPNEVFDPYRGKGLSWNELKQNFEKMIGFIRKHYPWLTFVSVREGAGKLREYEHTSARFTRNSRNIVIETTPGFIFRVKYNDYRLGTIEGAQILHKYRRNPSVILKATLGKVTVNLR